VSRWLAGSFWASQLAQLWEASPPSLGQKWARHAASARIWDSYYEDGTKASNSKMKYARWCWAGVSIAVSVVVLFITWWTHSLTRVLLTAAGIALAVWLL
jgi:hypothetical protein